MAGILFPRGEYHEDSFYFTGVIHETLRGMLSTRGRYFYTERDDSSQRQHVDFPRLVSKMNVLMDRIRKFRELDPEWEESFRRIEDDFYFYLLFAQAKGTRGVEIVVDRFVPALGRRPRMTFTQRRKLLLLRVFGYSSLRRICRSMRRRF